MGNSHQRGWVIARGRKWYGYYRKTVLDPITNMKKVRVVPVILGLKSDMTKFQAREALEKEITKRTGRNLGGRVMQDGSVSFGWFVRNRYFPLKDGDWNEETAKVKKLIIKRDLIDAFDSVPLDTFDRFTLQLHLNKLARTESRDRVLQIRAYLRDLFAEAVDQDFLAKDPARKLNVPTRLRKSDKTTLTWPQMRTALSSLPLSDRVLLELDMTDALRPGELFALRWKGFNYRQRIMQVTETVYRGKIRPWGKTPQSLGPVHIPKQLADDLRSWQQHCPDSSPEAFIFPNKRGGFMNADNYRKRVLHKLAEQLGIPRLTFQVIRRSIATLAQRKGTVKDVQGVLRHSRTPTTTDVYMQVMPEGVQATVNAINAELRGKTAKEAKRMGTLLPNATKLGEGVPASC